jgi:hypothetical protein
LCPVSDSIGHFHIDVPDGIIAHLTRECGENVHDHHIADVMYRSFERETITANPHSGAYENRAEYAAKNAADLEVISCFSSAYRLIEGIPHTRNNWLCYDFKERRIVPTHCTIRTNSSAPGYNHLKSWLVETSVDGHSWQEVARERIASISTASFEQAHLRSQAMGSAASSGW